MFLLSFNICFVFANACFMCICLKTAIWLILALFGKRSGFFGEDELATLAQGASKTTSILKKVADFARVHR